MKTNNETTRQRWTIAISAIPLLVGACIGIWLLMGGSSRFGPSFDNTSRTRTVSRVSTNPSLSPGVGIRDIEDIRVGERVFAHNPQLSDEEHNIPDPDPAIWRKLDLAITKDDGYRLDITLLRPLEWLEERKAVVGGTVSLDIPEMNAYGVATVLNISECPPIKSGPGRVVIGTFRHTSGDTLNVGISGLDKPIGTTADHPFWSEDRQEFVAVGKLQVGEDVRTFSGQHAQITSITRRGPPEPVYNLEVHGENVYYVSRLGILVHNYNESMLDDAHRRLNGLSSQDANDIRIFQASIKSSRDVYNRVAKYNDFTILQRSDLFDGGNLKTNVWKILTGKSPTLSGETINLHHVGKSPRGPIVEVRRSHNIHPPKTGGPLHIPGPSAVKHDSTWRDFVRDYWAERLKYAVESGVVPRELFDEYVASARTAGQLLPGF